MASGFITKKINRPAKLGKALKKARKAKGLTLSKVEKKTKIKIEYLKALENNQVDNLPDDIYVRGFLRSLAILYQVDSVKIIDKYREQKDPHQPKEKSSIDFRNSRLKEPLVLITPRIITIGLGIVVGLFLIGYLWYEISGFAIPPKLVLNRPAKEALELSKNKLTINGSTDSNASVTINQEPIPVDQEGNFKQEIKLQPGYNVLNIIATNQGGKTSNKELKVIVNKKYAKIP
jgi:cytoskeletal protein RodZ